MLSCVCVCVCVLTCIIYDDDDDDDDDASGVRANAHTFGYVAIEQQRARSHNFAYVGPQNAYTAAVSVQCLQPRTISLMHSAYGYVE